MRVLVDTNVVLDVLLDRREFINDSLEVFRAAEEGNVDAFLCATTVTTLHYLCAKANGNEQARQQIQALLKIFSIAPVSEKVLVDALELPGKDFEDNVIISAAAGVGASVVVSRDRGISQTDQIKVSDPKEFLRYLKSTE